MNMSEEIGSRPCSPCPVWSWLGETERRAARRACSFLELTCSPLTCESTAGPARQERSQRGLRRGCSPNLHPEPGVEGAGVLGRGWSFHVKKLSPQAHADDPDSVQFLPFFTRDVNNLSWLSYGTSKGGGALIIHNTMGTVLHTTVSWCACTTALCPGPPPGLWLLFA